MMGISRWVSSSVLLLTAGMLSVEASAQERCPGAGRMTAGLQQPQAAVRYLADDSLQGRLAGSASERCAGAYLAAQFKRLGLRPAGEGGTYFQSLPLATVLNPHFKGGTGRNVIGLLPGRDAKGPVVVIGAHYDHLGMGGPTSGSLAPETVAVHHGADDNASGTAALLRVAERLAHGARPQASVVFVAFTGEEEGLLGSNYFAAHPTVALARMRAMLNMDMVGRLGTGKLLVYGTGTAKEWPAILASADAGKDSLALNEIGDGYGASDHTSFYERDVPVLHFFTNVHGDYHKPSDTWDKIDYAGIDRVAGLVSRVATDVAGRTEPLTLIRGAGKPAGKDSAATPGYGAYLGTIPDFTPVEKGVKISGVRGGSPAEKAGLAAGDIIVAFDDKEIKDLYAMTDGLRARKPGETLKITVLRNGQPVTMTAVLGKR
ncbi:MAG TPA: M28 family peptidase [Longimicrobiales bacterium]